MFWDSRPHGDDDIEVLTIPGRSASISIVGY